MCSSHISVEFEEFLNVLKCGEKSKEFATQSMVKKSIYLLGEYLSCRPLIFGYFGQICDICVEDYRKTTNVDIKTGLKLKSTNNQALEAMEIGLFSPIQEKLETLVLKSSAGWPRIVATWSLDIIGSLTKKHTTYDMTISATSNYWLNSNTMRGLVGLITNAFRKMDNTDLDKSIDELINVFSRYSTDWLVSRIGICFPYQVILKLLQYSLNRFTYDMFYKFTLEIGVLEYLSFSHEKELKIALRELLAEGFSTKKNSNASIIPFLLVISNYSETMLQNLVDVFVEMYNDDLCAVIVQKSSAWKTNKLYADMQPSLNNIALRTKNHGVQILMSVAKMVEQYAWCQLFLEFSLRELEQYILSAKTCPLFKDLNTEKSKSLLWKASLSTNVFEQQTAVRLLLIASTQHNHIYYQTISELLRKSYEVNKLGITALVRMIGGQSGVVEFPCIKPGLKMVLEDVLLQQQFPKSKLASRDGSFTETYNTFQNLKTLVLLYKSNNSALSRETQLFNALHHCLPKILEILNTAMEVFILRMTNATNGTSVDKLEDTHIIPTKAKPTKKMKSSEISDNDLESIKSTDDVSDEIDEEQQNAELRKLVHTIIDLLNTIEVGGRLSVLPTSDMLKLAVSTSNYFFFCLTEKSDVERLLGVKRCCLLLQRLCKGRNTARTAAVRELIEGALLRYGYLFGQIDTACADELEVPENEFVFVQNKRYNHGPISNRTVLHAGVIGRGLRADNYKKSDGCDSEVQLMYLKALNSCFEQVDNRNIYECYSTISLMLLELVSPDVMYNGLPFPEEEFSKVTMERDLLIKRAFLTSPILWTILGFLATRRPALCFTSVLLRALCATCLHQWRAKNVNKFETVNPNDELINCTKKLLEVLALGQLLPPPLSNLHVIIEYFEPLEIALVLKECVWNYLKDFVPAPTLFLCDGSTPPWRNPHLSQIPPQYVDPLRNLMQKKLTKLGSHYFQMFIMPELNNNVENVKIEKIETVENDKDDVKKT